MSVIKTQLVNLIEPPFCFDNKIKKNNASTAHGGAGHRISGLQAKFLHKGTDCP